MTTAEFEEEIQDCSTPILVDVMAVWCGPCQLMAPQLEEVAKKFDGRVRFLKVDSDEEEEVASTLQIRGLPTILLINDMSIIMRAEGALMADELEQLVRRRGVGARAEALGVRRLRKRQRGGCPKARGVCCLLARRADVLCAHSCAQIEHHAFGGPAPVISDMDQAQV